MPDLSQMPINPTETSQPSLSPASEVAPLAPEPANPFQLPPEIAQVPVVQMISLGQPPAVRVGSGEYYPELEVVMAKADALLENGLDIYGAMDKSIVLFNPLMVTAEELQHLDQTGQLAQAVPDYAEITGSMPQEVSDAKVSQLVDSGDALAERLTAAGAAPQTPPPGPGAPTPVPSAPASVQAAAARNQVQNLQAAGGSPTSGPRPGGGRLLNTLLRPTAPV